MMVAQHCECTKCHLIVHLKVVNFTLHGLHLNSTKKLFQRKLRYRAFWQIGALLRERPKSTMPIYQQGGRLGSLPLHKKLCGQFT